MLRAFATFAFAGLAIAAFAATPARAWERGFAPAERVSALPEQLVLADHRHNRHHARPQRRGHDFVPRRHDRHRGDHRASRGHGHPKFHAHRDHRFFGHHGHRGTFITPHRCHPTKRLGFDHYGRRILLPGLLCHSGRGTAFFVPNGRFRHFH